MQGARELTSANHTVSSPWTKIWAASGRRRCYNTGCFFEIHIRRLHGGRMKRLFWILSLVLMAGLLPASAQTPSTGAQLSGPITDPSGAVIRGATVTLHSEATGLERSTTSDAAGQYRFLFVPAGRYSL